MGKRTTVLSRAARKEKGQATEYLPSKCGALSSNPSTTKKRKKEKQASKLKRSKITPLWR
jgi:hypothetical protein